MITMAAMPEVVCVGVEGGLTITFTVADECGNETTCTANIRIEDTIPVRSSPTVRQTSSSNAMATTSRR